MKGGVSQTSWAGGQSVQLKIWLLRKKKRTKAAIGKQSQILITLRALHIYTRLARLTWYRVILADIGVALRILGSPVSPH